MIVEVGDFERFEKAPKFASFLGLVPSEDSSDTRVNRYSITKAGNSHLRRLLVEATPELYKGKCRTQISGIEAKTARKSTGSNCVCR